MKKQELLSKVEHTILKPDTTFADVERFIEDAASWGCRGCCFPPSFTEEAVKYREDNNLNTRLVTVAAFPFGYHSEKAVWTEIRELVTLGADEVDVVGPTYLLKSGRWEDVRRCLGLYREAASDVTLKLIMETGLLSDEEIRRYCTIAAECKIDYAKTSSGFAGKGASVHAVRIMRETLPPEVKIKASGGIRTLEDMLAMLDAGADVLGMSRAAEALADFKEA